MSFGFATVRVSMPSATVRMSMGTAVLEDEDAHHVDEKAEHGDEEETFVFDFGRLECAFDGLREDEECNK